MRLAETGNNLPFWPVSGHCRAVDSASRYNFVQVLYRLSTIGELGATGSSTELTEARRLRSVAVCLVMACVMRAM